MIKKQTNYTQQQTDTQQQADTNSNSLIATTNTVDEFHSKPSTQATSNTNYKSDDDSDLRLLNEVYQEVIVYGNEEYLYNFSSEELAYIRNTIYAAHGYIFKTPKYREYFESKSWYTPTTTNQNIINDNEKKLAEIIKQYE